MKKMNIIVFQLIAAIVALIGSGINLAGLFISIPSWLSIVCAAVLLLDAAAWLIIYLLNTKK